MTRLLHPPSGREVAAVLRSRGDASPVEHHVSFTAAKSLSGRRLATIALEQIPEAIATWDMRYRIEHARTVS